MKAPSPMKPERLRELSEKANAGTLTKEERDELILGHTRLATVMAKKFAKSHEYLAEDLESMAYLAVIKAVDKAQGRIVNGNINPWIRQVVRNQLRDSVNGVKEHDPYPTETETDPLFRLDEEIDDVCWDDLDKALLQRRLDGKTDREIAAELDISESAVRLRRHEMQRRYNRHEEQP
jgi:RNA polymerase sigma factor (sigma-70 family)